MATVRKTITLEADQNNWIKAQVASGDYTNHSEYLGGLIRREQEKASALKTAIDEGLASGPSERSLDDIWSAAEAKARFANAVVQGLTDVREGNTLSSEETRRLLGIVSSPERTQDYD